MQRGAPRWDWRKIGRATVPRKKRRFREGMGVPVYISRASTVANTFRKSARRAWSGK
jgi:hypothetical protein